MWETLSLPAFWFGAFVLSAYQAAKFSELNSPDPTVREQTAVIPNLRANDFAGRTPFFATLAAFLIATLVTYFIICSLSPPVLLAWADLTGVEDAEAFADSVPYPLYIAAAFLGLTQPAIPGLSRIGDLQKNFFHYWIGVPKKVIATSDFFSNQILARSESNEDLQDVVKALASDEWVAKTDPYADALFYKAQIKRLKIAEQERLDQLLGSSKRELRSLIEQLVYAAALATVRESGGRALHWLANDLDVKMPSAPSSLKPNIGTAILFLFGLVLLWILLPIAHPVVELAVGISPLWPDHPATSAQSVLSQAVPIIASVGITLMWLSSHTATGAGTASASGSKRVFLNHFYQYSTLYLLIMTIVILFDWLQVLYDYGYFQENISAGTVIFFLSWLPYFILHATISIVVCYIVVLQVNKVRLALGPNDIRLKWTVMLSVVTLLAALYAWARWTWQLSNLPRMVEDSVSGFHFLALMVVLNVAAATLGFLVAISYSSRQTQKAPTQTKPSTEAGLLVEPARAG